MQLKRKSRDVHDEFSDKVFAAMETGNHAMARTALREYREDYPEHSERLRTQVIAGYGVAL